MENIACQAYKLKMQIRDLEKQYDSLMSCLKVSFSQGQSRWDNYQLTQTLRPGAVEYSAIPELKSVDLDKYRKDPVAVFKLEYLGNHETN